MTKKDYIAFAKAIKETRMEYTRMVGSSSPVAFLVEKMCDIFVADNPRFNRETFLKACDG